MKGELDLLKVVPLEVGLQVAGHSWYVRGLHNKNDTTSNNNISKNKNNSNNNEQQLIISGEL